MTYATLALISSYIYDGGGDDDDDDDDDGSI
jgi:hypothetical protein